MFVVDRSISGVINNMNTFDRSASNNINTLDKGSISNNANTIESLSATKLV